MADRQFHISDILSVSTGKTVSNRGIKGMHDITSHIVGEDSIRDSSFLIQSEAARHFIQAKLAWTQNIKFPELPKEATEEQCSKFAKRFVKINAAKYGEYHDVPQMARGQESHSADVVNIAARHARKENASRLR